MGFNFWGIFFRKPENCNHKLRISGVGRRDLRECDSWQWPLLLLRDPTGKGIGTSPCLYTVSCKKCGFSQDCEME